jgi:hypothetical protein
MGGHSDHAGKSLIDVRAFRPMVSKCMHIVLDIPAEAHCAMFHPDALYGPLILQTKVRPGPKTTLNCRNMG